MTVRKIVYIVAGARPNFSKIAPLARAFQSHENIQCEIVHTGQHYDFALNDAFFEELEIPRPAHNFHIGSGTHAYQTGKVMLAFETLCLKNRPDCTIVVGDVNSTAACAITAKKLHVPVAHVEAGLRSGDIAMPQEVNRLLTDSISDWLFATEQSAIDNLLREGKNPAAIFHVGHVMVDNLLFQLKRLAAIERSALFCNDIKERLLADGLGYAVITLHRPSNVDDDNALRACCEAIKKIAEFIPVFFPAHPRTMARLEKLEIHFGKNIYLTNSLSYMAFLNLWKDAHFVLTDSGGLQEETTALGIPCLTMRNSTERPVTVEIGSNTIVGTNTEDILSAVHNILYGQAKRGTCPELWDGQSANRIAAILATRLT